MEARHGSKELSPARKHEAGEAECIQNRIEWMRNNLWQACRDFNGLPEGQIAAANLQIKLLEARLVGAQAVEAYDLAA